MNNIFLVLIYGLQIGLFAFWWMWNASMRFCKLGWKSFITVWILRCGTNQAGQCPILDFLVVQLESLVLEDPMTICIGRPPLGLDSWQRRKRCRENSCTHSEARNSPPSWATLILDSPWSEWQCRRRLEIRRQEPESRPRSTGTTTWWFCTERSWKNERPCFPSFSFLENI